MWKKKEAKFIRYCGHGNIHNRKEERPLVGYLKDF
jgi:hypothetical protein